MGAQRIFSVPAYDRMVVALASIYHAAPELLYGDRDDDAVKSNGVLRSQWKETLRQEQESLQAEISKSDEPTRASLQSRAALMAEIEGVLGMETDTDLTWPPPDHVILDFMRYLPPRRDLVEPGQNGSSHSTAPASGKNTS